jgi:hypothetical protein
VATPRARSGEAPGEPVDGARALDVGGHAARHLDRGAQEREALALIGPHVGLERQPPLVGGRVDGLGSHPARSATFPSVAKGGTGVSHESRSTTGDAGFPHARSAVS